MLPRGSSATLARAPHWSKRLRPIEFLHRGLRRNPAAVAIAGPGAPMSYTELAAAVDALASGFQALDPRPGSRVATCARNTREHLLAVLATYAAGKTWVPLNPRNGRAELNAMIATTMPRIIVADASCADRFSPTAAGIVIGKPSSEAAGARPSVASLIATHAGQRPALVPRQPADEQIIKFSGGSTGTPKAVVQSVGCLEAQARGLLEFFEFRDDDVNLIAAPLTHGASCFILPILAAGGAHLLVEDPKPAPILDALESAGVTTMYAPPTLIYGLLGDPTLRGRSFPALRHLI